MGVRVAKKPVSITVADSDYFVLNILRTKLEEAGFKVRAVRSAEELLKSILADTPDLILTELLLSGTDGLSMIKAISNHHVLKKIPLIVHSGCSRKDAILNAIKCGAANYIVKPASFHTLLAKIKAELEKRGIAAPAPVAAAPSVAKEELDDDPIKAVTRRAKELLALPHAVQRALEAAKDPRTDAAGLAHIIESDTAITATILRKSNTVAYGRSEPILDVRDAIVRLGFKQAMGLVCAMAVAKSLQREEKSLGFRRLEFWEHSLAAAVIASEIARQANCDPSEAFIGGLLHDIGKLILDQCLPEVFEQCIESAHRDGRALADAMQDQVGFSHVQIALALLEHWGFPEFFRLVVEDAHRPRLDDGPPRTDWERLGRVVQAGNILAKAFGFGASAGQLVDPLDNIAADTLKISSEQSFAFRKNVSGELQAFKTFLGLDAAVRPELFDSNFSIQRIFLLDYNGYSVNTLALFLEHCGFIVHVAEDMAQVLLLAREHTQALLAVQAAPLTQAEAVVQDLAALDESIPVLFIGNGAQVGDWKRSQFTRRTEVAAVPVACSGIVHRITNLGGA